jgi:hypothetical protein
MSAPRVERVHGGGYIVRGEFTQTDWHFPGLAQSLGWSLTRVQKGRDGRLRLLKRRPTHGTFCPHDSTDGTVTCRGCGLTAGEFIYAASDFLDSRS